MSARPSSSVSSSESGSSGAAAGAGVDRVGDVDDAGGRTAPEAGGHQPWETGTDPVQLLQPDPQRLAVARVVGRGHAGRAQPVGEQRGAVGPRRHGGRPGPAEQDVQTGGPEGVGDGPQREQVELTGAGRHRSSRPSASAVIPCYRRLAHSAGPAQPAIYNDRHQLTGFGKVTRDVTAQRTVEEALRHSAGLTATNDLLRRQAAELSAARDLASHITRSRQPHR